jgi:hypothetical protein
VSTTTAEAAPAATITNRTPRWASGAFFVIAAGGPFLKAQVIDGNWPTTALLGLSAVAVGIAIAAFSGEQHPSAVTFGDASSPRRRTALAAVGLGPLWREERWGNHDRVIAFAGAAFLGFLALVVIDPDHLVEIGLAVAALLLFGTVLFLGGVSQQVVRLLVGVVSLTSLWGALCHRDRSERCVLVAVGLVALLALAGWEVLRALRWRYGEVTEDERGHDTIVYGDEPDRSVLWAFGPLALVAGVVVAILVIRDRRGNLSGDELAELLVVTAFGEELLFRGALLALAFGVFRPTTAEWWTAAAFGAWHIPNAVKDGAGDSFAHLALSILGTFVVTAAGGLLFSFLRHRSRSLAGAVSGHVATNLPGLALRSVF